MIFITREHDVGHSGSLDVAVERLFYLYPMDNDRLPGSGEMRIARRSRAGGRPCRPSAMLFMVIGLVMATWGCRPDAEHGDHHPGPGQQPDPETRAMIDSVRKAQAAVDPMRLTVFLCRERAAIYKQRAQVTRGMDQLNFMVLYGFELLKAGESAEALQVFDQVLRQAAPLEIPGKEKTLLEVKKLKALAALRFGEQENCILNHTSASCVIPVREAGQHGKPAGSELAMSLYREILAEDPADLTSRFLFNLAAMTLGRWPGDIPAALRLPDGFFTSRTDFPFFEDIAPAMGLDLRGLAGGICIEDFDRDGHLDLLISAWGFQDQLRYFRNTGDGRFEEKTAEAGLTGVTGGLNMAHADYNNDGYADILLMRGAWFRDQGRIPNSLLHNNGDGTFTDVTVKAGLYHKAPTQSVTWADFDLDGWLDLFSAHESIPGQPGTDFPSILYRNNRDGTFTDITAASGFAVNAYVKGATAGDINADGLPDLYLSVLQGPNQLWLNLSSPDGIRFRDISQASGTQEPFVAFPSWMFDYDQDGRLDIFVSAYSDGSEDLPAKMLRAYGRTDDPFRPRLYRNNGDLTFTDMSVSAGLTEPAFAMGCSYGDLDMDGYPDFYLATGEPNLKSAVPNKMYLNLAGQSFADITYTSGFGNIQKGHGTSFGDLDRDGDEDLYVVMGGSFEGDVYQNLMFANPGHPGHHWLVLRLEGREANRLAIGAQIQVDVETQGAVRTIHHMVTTGTSFGGNSLQAEIGLGPATIIREVRIAWPSRTQTHQRLQGLSPDKAYLVVQGQPAREVDYGPTPFRPGAPSAHHH